MPKMEVSCLLLAQAASAAEEVSEQLPKKPEAADALQCLHSAG